MVSHDLKSPLRSIYALVNWLKEDNKDKLDESSIKNIGLIESSLEKMERLISDILNYSIVTSNARKKNPLDLNQIITELRQVIFFPSHIELKLLNPLPIVMGDETRFQQLFQNLISNSISYIDKEVGLIEIDCIEKNFHYQFSVKDNGVGIKKENYKKIFRIFHSLEKRKESSGIGLSIVKKIVSLYGGEIWLESEYGKGTTFYFTIKKTIKMKVNQLRLNKDHKWEYIGAKVDLKEPLVFVFGDRMLLEKETIYGEMRDLFPDGHIVFGSTSGNIISNEVNNSISITAIEFEKSSFVINKCNVLNSNLDSFKTGSDLIKQFDTENLKLVFILSEGSFINGSELTNGLNSASKSTVLITGGLCGDNDRFERTIASYDENPKSGEIIAIGFYGDTIDVSFSVHGGWIPFGPERIVTKSESNVLYELDGVPALDLYKKYLGNQSNELPGSALLYPLNVRLESSDKSFTRTILKY